MLSTLLVIVFGVAPLAQPAPQELVEQLGSPRFAVREAASETLRKMGREGLPTLTLAKQTNDPEIQNRAVVLIDELERRLVLQPSLVELDSGSERPLGRLVRELNDQTGFDLELAPGRDPHWPSQLVEVEKSDGPIPFWEAIEQLNLDVEAADRDELRRFGIQASPVLRLSPRREEPRPSWREGPFQAVVRGGGIRFSRLPNPNLPAPGFAGAVRSGPRPPAMPALQIDLQAEPRLSIRSAGALTVLEATDSEGRSLLPTDPDNRVQAINESALDPGGPSLSLLVMLEPPNEPVERLKQLRIRVPIEVVARRIEPQEFPIEGAETPNPQPLWLDDLALTVLGTTRHPRLGVMSIEVLAVPQGWNELQNPNMQRRRFEMIAQDFDRIRKSLEVVGPDGHPIEKSGVAEGRFAPEGIRLSLNVPLDVIPAKLRYFGTIQETTEVTIELEDVPLPSLD